MHRIVPTARTRQRQRNISKMHRVRNRRKTSKRRRRKRGEKGAKREEGTCLELRTSVRGINSLVNLLAADVVNLAMKAKKEAEEAFEACSDVARHEIKRLHRVRCSEMTDLLSSYGKLQLDAAVRQHALLLGALNNLKTVVKA
ncbi:hypothetical protein FHG87_010736 [Trinorchestia longiramus]|nr:hypothetical protein FHG87_010736 [Trinorchestia longiramus]